MLVKFTGGSAATDRSRYASLAAFSSRYAGTGIVTGSMSLQLRGLIRASRDIDIIVPTPADVESVVREFSRELTGIVPRLDGRPYEAQFALGGVPFEVWSELGPGMPVPQIALPFARDILACGDALVPVRPLPLLLLDYRRAISSDYPASAAKRDAYLARCELVERALQFSRA